MNRQNWKQKEVNFLKANIDRLGVEGCATELGRSSKSVWCKAQKMHILLGDLRCWSKVQEDNLIKHFGKMPSDKLAELLNVSVSSLYHKAQRIGIKHSRWWTEEEVVFLKENYRRISNKEISNAIGRTSENIQNQAYKIGIAKKNFYPKDRYCADCGKKLANKYVTPVYCKECYYKHNSGENSHFWKGGLTSLISIIYRKLWATWKKSILERDEFKCKLCGSDELLEVHHIVKLIEIRDNVIAENPYLKIGNYDDRVILAKIIVDKHKLNEGITLCQSCHKAYHTAKRDELLGNPNGKAEDNQQPSQSNVVDFVDWKVQRAMAEETTTNKANTSVPHTVPNGMMMCSELTGNRKR